MAVPSVKLNSGYDFPLIGYGTFGGANAPEQVYEAAKVALKDGYRHFDTAYVYRTENALGRAIKESDVPREDLFVTTKLWNCFHRPEHVRPVLELSLKDLGLDYVDLYLIHWPISYEFRGYDPKSWSDSPHKIIDVPAIDTWRAMEQFVKDGLVKSIGVSNFTIEMLEDLLRQAEIPPAVNQVEIHPSLPQTELLDYCKSKGITLTAFSPLGNPGWKPGQLPMFDDPVINRVAEKYKKTAVQVLLNWGVNRGYAVIPKSATPDRIKANLEYFHMDPEDVEDITKNAVADKKNVRICDPIPFFGVDVFGEKK